MERKGQSEILVVVLLVLIGIVAILLVWFGVRTVVHTSGIEASRTQAKISAVFVPISVNVDTINPIVNLMLKSDVGSGNIVGALVTITDSSGLGRTFTVNQVIGELETKNFVVNYTDTGLNNLTKIEIRPLLQDANGVYSGSQVITINRGEYGFDNGGVLTILPSPAPGPGSGPSPGPGPAPPAPVVLHGTSLCVDRKSVQGATFITYLYNDCGSLEDIANPAKNCSVLITASDACTSSSTLRHWDCTPDGFASYHDVPWALCGYQAPPTSGFGTVLPSVAWTTTEADGQIADGTYYYVITAVNSEGYETYAGAESRVNLISSGFGGAVHLYFYPVDGAVSYKVYRSTVSGHYAGNTLVLQGITTDSLGGAGALDNLAVPMKGQPPNVNGRGLLATLCTDASSGSSGSGNNCNSFSDQSSCQTSGCNWLEGQAAQIVPYGGGECDGTPASCSDIKTEQFCRYQTNNCIWGVENNACGDCSVLTQNECSMSSDKCTWENGACSNIDNSFGTGTNACYNYYISLPEGRPAFTVDSCNQNGCSWTPYCTGTGSSSGSGSTMNDCSTFTDETSCDNTLDDCSWTLGGTCSGNLQCNSLASGSDCTNAGCQNVINKDFSGTGSCDSLSALGDGDACSGIGCSTNYPNSACSGTIDCSTMDESSCDHNSHCRWSKGTPTCSGNAVCSGITTDYACGYAGCTWDYGTSTCSGGAINCGGLDEYACWYAGCDLTYSGAGCGGGIFDCSQLSDEQSCYYSGCSWNPGPLSCSGTFDCSSAGQYFSTNSLNSNYLQTAGCQESDVPACAGNANCNVLNSQSLCQQNGNGCNWQSSYSCTGSYVCSDLNQDICQSKGCTWA